MMFRFCRFLRNLSVFGFADFCGAEGATGFADFCETGEGPVFQISGKPARNCLSRFLGEQWYGDPTEGANVQPGASCEALCGP